MATIQVFHHKRCTKSNQALNYLKEKGFSATDIDTVLYMEQPIHRSTAEQLATFFASDLSELIRKPDLKALGIELPTNLTKEWVVEAILKEPKIMQRPIVIANGKAIIARPTEKIDTILV